MEHRGDFQEPIGMKREEIYRNRIGGRNNYRVALGFGCLFGIVLFQFPDFNAHAMRKQRDQPDGKASH